MAVVEGRPPMADVVTGWGMRNSKRWRDAGGTGLAQDAGRLIAGLRRYSELMATPGVLSEEYRYLAQDMQVLSDRSAAMLGRFVVPGTAEMAPSSTAARMEATVLPEAVLECLGLLSKIAGRAVTFFCSPSAYLPVAVSRTVVQRVLMNLVKNAAEAGPEGETVAVTLVGMRNPGQDGAQLVLTVQGRGRRKSSGRALAGPRVGDGDARRGIGFDAVCELAEGSGATVEIESERDARTSVSVSWPAMDPRERRRGDEGSIPSSLRLSGLEVSTGAGAELLAGGEAC